VRRQSIWALLPLALLLLVHGRSVELGYVADDFEVLAVAADPARRVGEAFPAGGGRYWRPLTMASFAVVEAAVPAASPEASARRSSERPLDGRSARWQHLVNVLLHMANLGLLVVTLRLVGASPGLTLLAAAIFAAHPTTVEPVAWISGRGDLLCATFVLAGVVAFLRLLSGGSGGAAAEGGWVRLVWVVMVPLCGQGAALAKESGVAFPLVIAGVWVVVATRPVPAEGARGRGTVGLARWSLSGSAVVAAVFGWGAWQGAGAAVNLEGVLGGAAKVVLIAANALVLRLPSYSLRRWAQTEPWSVAAAVIVAGLAGIAIAVWLWRRGGSRRIAVAATVVAAALAPLAPLAPFGWAADRHSYLPLALLLVGIGAVLAIRVVPDDGRGRVAAACCVALVVVVTALGTARTGQWLENARLADSWCQSFRALALDPSRPVVVAGYPSLRGGVPVFSNDLSRALAFCRDARLGTTIDLVALGPLEVPAGVGDPGPAVDVALVGAEPLTVELRAGSGHFGRAPVGLGGRVGFSWPTPGAESASTVDLVVEGVDSAGDLVAFRVEVAGGREPLVLSMAPGGFRIVP
jgi:hypothetical protein